MELRSIQYFVQVADEGSITRTADKIGIAQPALTRHIKQLEAELGTQLLTRLPRGVRLTTSGRDFLDHARTIMLEVTRASEHVRSKAQSPRGRLRVRGRRAATWRMRGRPQRSGGWSSPASP